MDMMRATITANDAKKYTQGLVDPYLQDKTDGPIYWNRHINHAIRERASKKKSFLDYQFRALYSLDMRPNDLAGRMKRGKEILRDIIRYGEKLGYHIRLIDEHNDWQPYIIIDWS